MALQNPSTGNHNPAVDVYQTIECESQGIFKDKGSRFLAYAFPVKTESEIKEILAKLRKEHYGARHFCFAWRLGTENIHYRANDDGEPSSTAGKPILGQLLGFNLTNTLVVVIRYFGGTLLGTSGLINAYKNAASEALKNAKIIQGVVERSIKLDFTYKEVAEVMNRVKQENLNISEIRLEENCLLVCQVRKSDSERIKNTFSEIYGVKVTIDPT